MVNFICSCCCDWELWTSPSGTDLIRILIQILWFNQNSFASWSHLFEILLAACKKNKRKKVNTKNHFHQISTRPLVNLPVWSKTSQLGLGCSLQSGAHSEEIYRLYEAIKCDSERKTTYVCLITLIQLQHPVSYDVILFDYMKSKLNPPIVSLLSHSNSPACLHVTFITLCCCSVHRLHSVTHFCVVAPSELNICIC